MLHSPSQKMFKFLLSKFVLKRQRRRRYHSRSAPRFLKRRLRQLLVCSRPTGRQSAPPCLPPGSWTSARPPTPSSLWIQTTLLSAASSKGSFCRTCQNEGDTRAPPLLLCEDLLTRYSSAWSSTVDLGSFLAGREGSYV